MANSIQVLLKQFTSERLYKSQRYRTASVLENRCCAPDQETTSPRLRPVAFTSLTHAFTSCISQSESSRNRIPILTYHSQLRRRKISNATEREGLHNRFNKDASSHVRHHLECQRREPES